MPNQSGFEVCNILKTSQETSDIPIIFITASGDKNNIEKGFKVGAVDYLTKPVNKIELLSRVSVHLNLQKNIQKLEESEQSFKQLFNHMTNGFAYHQIIC